MAPGTVNKPPKLIPKFVEKPNEKKKIKKKNFQNFSIYIYKLLRIQRGKLGISRKSMLIMNSFVNDMMEKIAAEASSLASHGKKTTLQSQEIQSAVKILLPGELAKHANMEGIKAVNLYHRKHQASK